MTDYAKMDYLDLIDRLGGGEHKKNHPIDKQVEILSLLSQFYVAHEIQMVRAVLESILEVADESVGKKK